MTIYGWDMSHYDAPDARHAITSEGFDFVTHKAGGDSNDSEIDDWWGFVKGLRAQALLGAYWVLYPGSPTGRADTFINRLDDTCPGWRDGPFILQADCEIWGGDTSTKPGLSDIRAFCNRLVSRAPKLRPIVYAPRWAYGNELAGLGYPLWASSYVTGSGSASSLYPGDSSSRWAAYSGISPNILQFTSSATIAGQTTCDANAYRGTLAELTALVAPGWEIDMPTSSDEIADAVVAKLTALTNWTDSLGGQHTPVGDAVLRSGYPQTPGAARTPLWTNLQALQTDITGIAASVQETRASVAAKIDALAAQMASNEESEAARDADNLARLLAAIGTGGGSISVEMLEQALEQVYGQAFSQAKTRAAQVARHADEDAATRAAREARQPHIQ